jgi:hypothetical protein
MLLAFELPACRPRITDPGPAPPTPPPLLPREFSTGPLPADGRICCDPSTPPPIGRRPDGAGSKTPLVTGARLPVALDGRPGSTPASFFLCQRSLVETRFRDSGWRRIVIHHGEQRRFHGSGGRASQRLFRGRSAPVFTHQQRCRADAAFCWRSRRYMTAAAGGWLPTSATSDCRS